MYRWMHDSEEKARGRESGCEDEIGESEDPSENFAIRIGRRNLEILVGKEQTWNWARWTQRKVSWNFQCRVANSSLRQIVSGKFAI